MKKKKRPKVYVWENALRAPFGGLIQCCTCGTVCRKEPAEKVPRTWLSYADYWRYVPMLEQMPSGAATREGQSEKSS